MEFARFVAINKVDEEKRIVWGYASTPALDSQGDRVQISAVADALPDYMRFANIREMHQPSAVGKAIQATVDDGGLYLGAHIVDDVAWKKVKAGVYNGFSIGGRVTVRDGEKITGLRLSEISLVDRPANPQAVFDVWKFDTGGSDGKGDPGMDPKVTETLAKLDATMAAQGQVLEGVAKVLAGVGGALEKIAGGVKGGPPADPPPDKKDGDPDTAHVLKLEQQVEALTAKLDEKTKQDAAAQKKKVLDAAQSAGKFHARDRKIWEQNYDGAPTRTEAILKSMAAVVPMNDRKGFGGDNEDQTADDRFMDLVEKEAAKIAELDKLPMLQAQMRAIDVVAKKHPDLYAARTEDSLRKAAQATTPYRMPLPGE